MKPESMVHALEQIHTLLVPGGHFIDIHPNGELVEIQYLLDGREQLVGYLQESDDYVEYGQADEALESVVATGLFCVEQTREFEFRTYADSFDELKDFLEKNWSDAIISDELIAHANELEGAHGIQGTVLLERVKIGLLERM